jgi:hypothetical protein
VGKFVEGGANQVGRKKATEGPQGSKEKDAQDGQTLISTF